eukprot:5169408-Prymnesium_polylepis.2
MRDYQPSGNSCCTALRGHTRKATHQRAHRRSGEAGKSQRDWHIATVAKRPGAVSAHAGLLALQVATLGEALSTRAVPRSSRRPAPS